MSASKAAASPCDARSMRASSGARASASTRVVTGASVAARSLTSDMMRAGRLRFARFRQSEYHGLGESETSGRLDRESAQPRSGRRQGPMTSVTRIALGIGEPPMGYGGVGIH